MKKLLVVSTVLLNSIWCFSSQKAEEKTVKTLGNASVEITNDKICVSTGQITRVWQWTGTGLKTTSLKVNSTGNELLTTNSTIQSDWSLPPMLNDKTIGKLVSVSSQISDDEKFTDQHIEVVSTVRYETAKIELQHVIWVYPNATGLRTQLRIKALPGFAKDSAQMEDGIQYSYSHRLPKKSARSEFLPISFNDKNQRRYWGYYNDPGSRHDFSNSMLKEEVVKGFPVFLTEHCDWASGMAVEKDNYGVCLVKESHKCVNQTGYNTGAFYCGTDGLEVTGWGLKSEDVVTDRYRECWANWVIVYDGSEDGLQLALKQFDRKRFPVNIKRDALLISDTWGGANPYGGWCASMESLKKELPAAAELGLDVVRIDDGWQQGDIWADSLVKWKPNYKNGWTDVKLLAEQNNMKLGIWAHVRKISKEELFWNWDNLQPATWKFDFDSLTNRTVIETRNSTFRNLIKYSDYKTQFALCPEYYAPRYGWYFMKEYGSLFFQNIQDNIPEHLIYVPSNSLFHAWTMSKYFNLNKLQTPVKNVRMVNREKSDAYLHSQSYAVSTALMGVPLFFELVSTYTPEEKVEIRKLIDAYKKEREYIFASYVFPIGESPSNAGWSGFQTYNPDMKEHYLMIYRELHSTEIQKTIQLKFLKGKTLEFTDLLSGKKTMQKVTTDGKVKFTIEKNPDYRFYKYQIIK